MLYIEMYSLASYFMIIKLWKNRVSPENDALDKLCDMAVHKNELFGNSLQWKTLEISGIVWYYQKKQPEKYNMEVFKKG